MADSGFVVRRHTQLDPELLASLVEAGREALGGSALDAWLLPVIASCGYLFVAREGEELIGAAEVIRCIEDGELYLEGLYVRPRFQGKGYGGHLLRRVTGAVRQQGFNRIRATVDPQNIPGLSLYWQAGFKQIGNLVDHYGPGKHRLLLSLDLEATDDDR